jgi:hypothetical protein
MNINKELLKSFIIGSSIPAFIILFIVVIYLFKIKEATFDYYRYSILAPIGMGLLSLFAKFISIQYKINLQICYFIISLFSALFVSINISRGEKAYNFKTKNRWYLQYLLIFIGHLFIYNKIIYPLDMYL